MATTSHFFVFGRTPQLAFLELRTLFPRARHMVDGVASVELDESLDVSHLMDILGGTTKIAKAVGSVTTLDGHLARFIDSDSHGLTFGVSMYGESTMPKTLLSDMKGELERSGRTARYIASRDGDPLTSVAIDKKHAEELIVIKNGDHYVIGKTLAVQAYEAWNARDYGRPHADAQSGMLPLKAARMIVNIALSTAYEERGARQKTLLDPFCGMGSVLAEAYMMGCRVIGCDTSDAAVTKARENLSWLMEAFPNSKGAVAKLFVADAVHVSDVLAPGSVHAIVSEPYMGSTDISNAKNVDPGKVRNILKGLEKLYIGCLRDWHKLLVPNGKIVIALPAYAISGRIYFVKKVVDMCENLGYTINDGPIEYSRPQATVKRMFYVLSKK